MKKIMNTKTTLHLAAAMILMLLMLMFTACGKSEFGVTENTGKHMTVTARNAAKDGIIMVGSLEAEEGEQIEISSDLSKGSIRIEIIGVSEEQSMDQLPDIDGEPVITAEVKGTDAAAGTVPAGSYMLKAACLEKATGTVQIAVKPAAGEVLESEYESAEKASEEAENASGSYETSETETSETKSVSGHEDGERFESIIMIEGMEEAVSYEHIRNSTVGIEMDYDYELFERHSEPDRECFVSRYDDPGNFENYLEVTYSEEDAESAAAAVSEALSKDYDIIREEFMLEGAGRCIRIDASADKDGLTMPEKLRMVYIIPADDGSRIATAHYSIEGAEGFGVRFRNMMHTLELIETR